MKRLSEAVAADFEGLRERTLGQGGGTTVDCLAQTFVDGVFDRFQQSIVLSRLFIAVPYALLPGPDRDLADEKTRGAGLLSQVNRYTPILTLMGTRGRRGDWNQRHLSNGFRCIPMVSSDYVASLPMLAMQLREMDFPLALLDRWGTTVVAENRADAYAGTLHVRYAGEDRDEQERMIVPRQDFVSENGIKTVLGFGAGYPHCPAIATFFLFTDEVLERAPMEPFASLVKAFLPISSELVGQGRFFA